VFVFVVLRTNDKESVYQRDMISHVMRVVNQLGILGPRRRHTALS